jgi:lipopolysaccharide transport system permease protein
MASLPRYARPRRDLIAAAASWPHGSAVAAKGWIGYRAALMTVALQHDARGLPTLKLTPDQTLWARQRTALRDVGEAATMWRLCRTLSWLDIKLRYRGSVLGPFWLTLSTGVMVGAMGVIYATLFKMDLHNYLPFLALSLVLWSYVGTLTADACATYTGIERLIRSMRMPYTLHAARVVLRNLLVLAHNLLVIVVVDLIMHVWPGATGLAVVPGIVVWFADSFAVTLLLGTVCARFRDIPPIVASVIQIAFFVTPVIWKPDLITEHRWLLPLNPFFSLLEIVRAPLLDEIPSLTVYGSAIGYSALLWVVSWLLFVRVRGRIAFWV